MLPEKSTIQEIFSVVKALSDTERKARKEFTKNARFRGQGMFKWLPIFSVIVAIVLCFLGNVLKIPLLFQVSLGFLGISYLAYVVILIVLTLRDMWNSRKMFQDPVGSLLDIPMRLAEIDVTSVNMLYNYEPEALKYVLVELKAERAALEKRTSLLVGAIDKLGIIGIIPGFIAFIKVIKVMNTEFIPNFPAAWVQILAYATPIWYFVGLVAHGSMTKLDRFIMLIEMVIETKKSGRSEEPFTHF